MKILHPRIVNFMVDTARGDRYHGEKWLAHKMLLKGLGIYTEYLEAQCINSIREEDHVPIKEKIKYLQSTIAYERMVIERLWKEGNYNAEKFKESLDLPENFNGE